MGNAYLRFAIDNRRFLLFGLFAAWSSSYGQTYFVSVFSADIRAEFDLSHGDFGLLYSLGTLASAICFVWLGKLIDRFDLPVFTVAAALGLAAATALGGLAQTAWMLFIALFGLRAFGQGLMSHIAMTSMARYFEADRGKAISIANLGFPIGQSTFPIIGVALAAAIGWREGLFAMAAVLAFVLTPALLFLLKGHGERHAALVARTKAAGESGKGPAGRQWTAAEVRRDPLFWLLQPGMMSLGFIGTGVIFHQVHMVDVKGWDLAWFAASFSIMAVVSSITMLAAGPLVDRIGARRLLIVFQIPAAIGLALLGSTDLEIVVPFYMASFGLSVGLIRVVGSALWAELYGVAHIGAIRALTAALMTFATAVSPVLMGWMIDIGIGIDTILWLSVAYIAAAVLMFALADRLRGGAEETEHAR